MHITSCNRSAFTLVELLLVAVILAILAVVVIPQFSDASEDVKISSVRATLQTVRSQLELYKTQHGTYPTLIAFSDMMTKKTDATGTNQADGKFGPYLQQMPVNPVDDMTTVANAQDATGGWAYDEVSGSFKSNDPTVTAGDTKTKDL